MYSRFPSPVFASLSAAFAIPIIHLIDQQKSSGSAKGIQALILVPTRELAIQITDAFETIGNNTKVNTTVVYGGVEQDRQINKLKDGADVLVATPGRMFDLINQKAHFLNKISPHYKLL